METWIFANKMDKRCSIIFKIPFNNKKRLTLDTRNLYTNIAKNSDKVVVISNKFIDIIKNELHIHNRYLGKFTAINNPIKTDICKKEYEKEKIVLWIGWVQYGIKRLDHMLEIWSSISKTHPDWQLIVLGDGYIDYFTRLAKKHNTGQVVFAGFQDSYEYFKRASVLCVTSSSGSWGMTIVDAHKFKCVPIAYNSFVSLPEVIENNKNGFIIKAYNKLAYIQKLEKLITDEPLRESFAQEGLLHIKKFETSSIAKGWISLFENLS